MTVPRSVPAAADDPLLDRQVRAELVRIAYHDALYGAPFGMLVALLFAYSARQGFPARIVVPWLLIALTCNVLRLVMRWLYLRQPVPVEDTRRWSALFIAVSGATGLSWGLGGWLFYTPHESIYRVLVVLVLAGMTTGASRLLAPILAANIAYVYLALGPLIARLILYEETRSTVLASMSVLYLVYMSVAARQQAATLRRTVRLGFEHTALVESLGAAKETAEHLNRDLSAEIARREVIETELRTASQRAVSANRAKSEFLATMSHEIRTPMNGIIGMLQIVREAPLAPAQRDQLATAAASADTLLDLLNDILDFSKIEAGKLELERIAFSPAAVVKSVADLLRPRADAKALEFQLEIDPRLPAALFGDPTRLRQILFNLLGNAIKFTERGRVRVSVTCEPGNTHALVAFTVTDTGIGISPEALERIFTPFTQADSSMSRRFGGTGLGLAISQKLIEAMDSTLQVHSGPGEGSTFQFALRLERAQAAPRALARPDAAPEFRPPALRGRVLVVEDDRVNQRVIGHFLKQMGLETGLAEDGPTAVDVAIAQSWDLVLMDCQLPGLDGLEATRQIRARRSGGRLPIIALTANASPQDRTACFAAGMDDFLTKPVRVELLATVLQKWLRPAAATATK